MPLVKRTDKETSLTHNELDSNFVFCSASADSAAAQALTADEKASAAQLALADKASKSTANVFDALQAFAKGVIQKSIPLAGVSIDVTVASHFTKTVTAPISLAPASVPAAGNFVSFILDLTNGGAFAVTWWAGIRWAGGTAPTLTATGRDVLGFYTIDGGATWTGLVLSKDAK